MKYLSDNEIIKTITDYTNNAKTNYAILIDGEWGTGKTFFVKNLLKPHLEENEKNRVNTIADYKVKKVIYVSLYGITSIDDVSKEILMSAYPISITTSDGQRALRIASKIGKVVLSGTLSYLNVSLPESKLTANDLLDTSNCIFIFDDLERCNMNINDILGYINGFVEHEGAKTVIIANQKEISRISFTDNLEMKYIVASNNKIIIENDDKKEEAEKEKKPNETFSLDETTKRIERIFSQNHTYNKIKEKLIGRIIYYRPDFDIVIKKLSDTYLMDTGDVIRNNMKVIIEHIKKYDHYNIRTLMFCFDKLDQIIKVLNLDLADRIHCVVLNQIFKYCLTLSIFMKQGREIPTWEEEYDIGDIDLEKKYLLIFNNIKGFKFVYDLVLNSTTDIEKSRSVISIYVDILRRDENTKSDIRMLRDNWWESEDEYVINMINKINTGIDLNIYDTDEYPTVVALFLELRTIGFKIDIQSTVDAMLVNVHKELSDSKIRINIISGYVSKNNVDEFNKYIDQLQLSQLNRKYSRIKSHINSIIGGDKWSTEFINFISEKRDTVINDKGFFKHIDIDLLFNRIINGTNSDIAILRYVIDYIYGHISNIKEYLGDDKDNMVALLEKIENYLKKTENIGLIRMRNLSLLIQQINKSVYVLNS